MAKISNTINGVKVEFGKNVKNDVNEKLIQGMKYCIKTNIAKGYSLNKIYISSAFDQHTMPSRHMQQKAVDISRINGKKMSVYYTSDKEVKAITDAIQETFEKFSNRRENFGPKLKKKNGKDHSVKGHNDHIHISVN